MTLVLKKFRILYGPQFGTYADETGEGVKDPSQLNPSKHRTMEYTSPDVCAVQVGLGLLFAEGLSAADHAVRVDIQLTSGKWSEYDVTDQRQSTSAKTMPTTMHKVSPMGGTVVTSSPTGRRRGPRRVIQASS